MSGEQTFAAIILFLGLAWLALAYQSGWCAFAAVLVFFSINLD